MNAELLPEARGSESSSFGFILVIEEGVMEAVYNLVSVLFPHMKEIDDGRRRRELEKLWK
jgi:hypothetical protein